ncbi:uncharacterized protein [Panulirus ornatus]|uniref:uncharacterized protein isoform X2 n=1 Tax=Panulirus ornatus TaxID=150431 RepID=UPI003A8A3920
MKFVILAAVAAVAVAVPQYNYYALHDDSSEEFQVVPVHYDSHSAESSEELQVAPIHYRGDSSEEVEFVPILKDVRVHEEDGRYNFEVETGNGIRLSQSGSPEGHTGAVNKAGEYSYTAPDGTPVVVKFVANEYGYQPQSDLLPVAPAFPHPIPQFVLDQIAFAAQEDAARARAGLDSSEEVEVTAIVPAPVPRTHPLLRQPSF